MRLFVPNLAEIEEEKKDDEKMRNEQAEGEG